MKFIPVAHRAGVSLALVAAILAGCPAPSEDPALKVQLSSSDGTEAELSITDPSGFVVSARNVDGPRSGDADIEVEAAPGAADAVKVSWVSSPCQEKPLLTVQGSSLDDLDLILDAGPTHSDFDCPDVGVVFSVILVLNGEVALQNVQGRRIGD